MCHPRAVVLIDGEHYPPVVAVALQRLGGDYEIRAGLFAGGREKLRLDGGSQVGVRASGAQGDGGETRDVRGSGRVGEFAGAGHAGDAEAALAAQVGVPRLHAVEPQAPAPHQAIAATRAVLREERAAVLLDLSDEPVIGCRERCLLISAALAEGVTYVAADAEVRPQEFARLTATPSLAVIGTGKRVGKTALGVWLARRLHNAFKADGGVVVLAVGRGGPPRPELIMGGEGLGHAELLAASRAGHHAASDCYEDAVLAGVTAVGCRRCGGGLAGRTVDDNVREALPLLESQGAALAVIEGSGAVVPPVAADATLCVAGAAQLLHYLAGCLGAYRLLISDALVLTQCEEPFATREQVVAAIAAARGINPALTVVPTVLRPRPTESIRGRRVAFFTTAPESAVPILAATLGDEYDAEVVLVSCDLADRRRLAVAVERAAAVADVFLTEIKAAAVDMVVERAAAAGCELIFADNRPVAIDGDLDAVVDRLAALAGERFAARKAVASDQGGAP